MKIDTNTNRLSMQEIEDRLLLVHDYPDYVVEALMPGLHEIDALRQEKNAVILAHYYQVPPIQLIADVKGDSLKLAREARKLDEGHHLVVSSTVRFMAEMVKLLNPERKVVVPDIDAGCSIAEGVNGDLVKRIRTEYPQAAIVGYINTYADAKAQFDSVCTSGNAQEVLRNIEGDPVIAVPDYFFATNVIKQLLAEHDDGRTYLAYKQKVPFGLELEDVRSGEITRLEMSKDDYAGVVPLLDRGTCIVHEQFSPGEIAYLRKKDNIDLVMAHPEVSPEVLATADFAGGTGKMIDYVFKTDARKYLVITECDLTAPLREAFPDKEFYTPCKLCPHMKKNSVEGVLASLRDEVYEIEVDPATSQGARKSLETMFALTGGGA